MTEGHYPYVARIDSRTDKPHKQREDTRTCAEDDCAVRLSKYNTKSSMCYMHVRKLERAERDKEVDAILYRRKY